MTYHLAKLSIENIYFRVRISHFHEIQLPIKISEEISSGFKFSQISFFTKKCSEFFSFNLLILKFWFMSFTAFFHYWLRPKNNTLVSGNAGDEKNLHPGGHKFIFLNRFSGVLLFSSLVSFALFDSCFCRCCYCLFVVFWT